MRPHTDIWKVEWVNNKWSAPTHLDFPFSSSGDEHYPTVADNGNIYFGSSRAGGLGGSDLYCIKKINNRYVIENLGPEINTANNEYEPFISKNERFIIYMATIPNGLANADFFISYFENGKWGAKARLPNSINSTATEWAPKLSRDGKFLFFGSTRQKTPKDDGTLSDIYYISTEGLNLK